MTDTGKTQRYEHHGAIVAVQRSLRGRHEEHCLCWQSCVHFRKGREDNCAIAEELFSMCVKHNILTPMWECPKFEATAL
jgi:hypothetical protein